MIEKFLARQSFHGYSIVLIGHAIVLFLIGLANGYGYLQAHRQDAPLVHDAAQNANGVQIGIAIAMIVIISALYVYRRRRGLSGRLLSGPFTTQAIHRVYDTVTCKRGPSVGTVSRAVLVFCLALVWLLGFNYYRAGLQVFAGMVQSWIVNAWGGPSYLGAMAAHYMDIILIFYGTALIIYVLTMPEQVGSAAVRRQKTNGRPFDKRNTT